jgi:AcrR family transcriptional regulator
MEFSPLEPRPPLRVRKKIQTWEAITSEAWTLFTKNGYDATTLEQIAEAAGVHKQTVLRYFKSKEDIALAYHRKTLEDFEKGLADRGPGEDVMSYWHSHVRRAARRVAESKGLLKSLQLIHDNPKVYAHFLALDRRYEELLTRAFSEESGTDPETDLSAMLLAAFLVAGNNSVARKLLAKRKLKDIESACLSVVDYARKHLPPRKRTRA